MVHVIVWIIFRYYTDKYSDGICMKNEKKTKTDNTTNLDPHTDWHTIHAHTFLFYFILFFFE